MATWYCCKCSFGPHNMALHTACISCGHPACEHCTYEDADADITLRGSEPISPYPCGPIPSSPEMPQDGVHLSNSEMALSIPSAPMPVQSLSAVGPNFSRIQHGSFTRELSTALIGSPGMSRTDAPVDGYLYICCQCGDGPKVYDVQPRCVTCNHSACSRCTHVR
ncbi:hypothetical protein C8Q69DRAFT_230260 [Paecilomyces variotii]|uniref:RanBP2-type domain-containing protein n=1 Tax=Byssochlamys spectabilis TaxID=264951 RepID=A0A443HW51_BYSSP|nr:hypothetical protein C8Q69DRAFT_230260 [Paecilomyces variotii]RWQ96065.1 hypothetical protein C8Q69DRAFT_230260 [Paecilomyces variotii]